MGLQGPGYVCPGIVYIEKVTVVYVRLSVRTNSPHNLHHTSHIENDKQPVVDLLSVAFSFLLLGLG